MATKKEREQTAAIAFLRTIIKPGATIYVELVNVARDGLSRTVRMYCGPSRCDLTDITEECARALNWTYYSRRGTLSVGGCGSDAGHTAVHSLAYKLYPDPVAIPEGHPRPFDFTLNDAGLSTPGYAIKHCWIN